MHKSPENILSVSGAPSDQPERLLWFCIIDALGAEDLSGLQGSDRSAVIFYLEVRSEL